MSRCYDNLKVKTEKHDPRCSVSLPCSIKRGTPNEHIEWFDNMTGHCLDYIGKESRHRKKVVGIMCEFTPRELIMAAGGIPVCLCGGSNEMAIAGEEHLPSNLCPLIKSTYGYSLKKANPFLQKAKLIVAETTCDGKKKMYELLAKRHPMHVLELPQKPEDPDAFAHWKRELIKLKRSLEKTFKTRITDDKIRSAIKLMNKERSLRKQLAELMKADEPPLSGRELLHMKSLISGIPCDMKQYELAIMALRGRQSFPDMRKRARVLVTGVPHPHGAEKIIDIIESSGGIVVCQENCSGLKPILDNVDEKIRDPITAIAKKYFHLPCSVMTLNNRRMDLIKTLAKEYRVDCIIDVVWQACLTYDIESKFVRELSESKLGIPYLKIETDYSPSDTARIQTRIQALFETALERKGMKLSTK